jgi:hypothetical protein
MRLFRCARRARVWCLLALFAAAVGAVHAGEPAPSVDVLKQALEKRLVSLKPSGMTERNVLFEDVKAGSASGGGYPFQVSASVRDYGPRLSGQQVLRRDLRRPHGEVAFRAEA